MENEIWVEIPNYNGIYNISSLGNVKSLSRHVKSGNGYITKERILKPCKNKKGYLNVVLCKENKTKTYSIHILIAMSFLKHIPDKTHYIIVDHIDNNPLNNRLNNLQLISQRENCSKDKKNKSSKYTGVNWDEPTKKWRAMIFFDKKLKHLGLFLSEIEASKVYENALNKLKNGTDVIVPVRENKLTKTKVIRITEIQYQTLLKMQSYKVDVADFIRKAISEKIKREYADLVPKPKKEHCPF